MHKILRRNFLLQDRYIFSKLSRSLFINVYISSSIKQLLLYIKAIKEYNQIKKKNVIEFYFCSLLCFFN